MRRLLVPVFLVGAGAFAQQPFAPDAIQFFEMKVRPVLHANCTGCHNDRKPASGLSLENRAAILTGGNAGPGAVPGNPGESRVIRAIEHSAELKMPPGGAKLKPEQIADLRHWVELGLPWPDAPVSKAV
ncbi:MAG: c-type cytochrome domain-containing protein, partial [Bryobacteraceae bacterium]